MQAPSQPVFMGWMCAAVRVDVTIASYLDIKSNLNDDDFNKKYFHSRLWRTAFISEVSQIMVQGTQAA